MSTTGPNLPAAGANTDNAGSALTWQNPGNILSDNNTRATVTLSGTTATDFLDATFGSFGIPADDDIDGIEIVYQRFASGGTAGQCRDSSVRIGVNGTPAGDDKATAVAWDAGGERNDSYGGAADTWNAGLTPADLNSGTFFARLAAQGVAAGADRVGRVDFVTATVTHTTPVVVSSGGTRHTRRVAAVTSRRRKAA